jgi:hypothetical protein
MTEETAHQGDRHGPDRFLIILCRIAEKGGIIDGTARQKLAV